MPRALHTLTAKVLLPIPGVPDKVMTLPLTQSKIKPSEVEEVNLCCRVSIFRSSIRSHSLSIFTAATNSSLSDVNGRGCPESLATPDDPSSSVSSCLGGMHCPWSSLRTGVNLTGTFAASPASDRGLSPAGVEDSGPVCHFLHKGGGAPQGRCLVATSACDSSKISLLSIARSFNWITCFLLG